MLPVQLQAVFDSYFGYLKEKGLDWVPVTVPADMVSGKPDGEFVQWHPVTSRVTAAELREAGATLGATLSPQYSAILQYKHFMELAVGDLGFFAHPSTGWQQVLATHVFQGHPRELLLDKGFLPFANCGDWGLYCFRLAERRTDGEYLVFRWDHDDPQQFEQVALDLYSALLQLHAP